MTGFVRGGLAGTLLALVAGCRGCGAAGDGAAPDDPSGTPRASASAPPDAGAWIPEEATTLPPGWACVGDPPPMTCFAEVQGTTFWMGAQATDPEGRGYDADALPDEAPPHEVTVSTFYILRNEVPATMLNLCVTRGWCAEDDVGRGPGATIDDRDHRDLPANMVTWAGAARFCAWLSGRLPTEAEWELAARGTDGRRFPWGDEPGCGTALDDPREPWSRKMAPGPCAQTGPVAMGALRGDSPYGLSGMAGNVWEWVADGYVEGFYARGAVTDPLAPADGPLRIQRGGGWADTDPVELRSAGRMVLPADSKLPDTGFRCVWQPPASRR